MKIKTIKSVLAKVHKEWLGSIIDKDVARLAKENTIITGGSIASMLLKEAVNDYDLYFRNLQTAEAVVKYYKDVSDQEFDYVINGEGRLILATRNGLEMIPLEEDDLIAAPEEKVEEEREKFSPVFISPNAISLTNKIQIIFRFYGEPDEIHENYDYVHCTNYWDSREGELVLRPQALECLLSRELLYVGSRYPVCSLIRLRKFIKRGWTVNAGQILKIVMQINELDLTDFEVLKDQLVGVDTAYFITLLEQLHEKDPGKVNSAYLMEIIDRIF